MPVARASPTQTRANLTPHRGHPQPTPTPIPALLPTPAAPRRECRRQRLPHEDGQQPRATNAGEERHLRARAGSRPPATSAASATKSTKSRHAAPAGTPRATLGQRQQPRAATAGGKCCPHADASSGLLPTPAASAAHPPNSGRPLATPEPAQRPIRWQSPPHRHREQTAAANANSRTTAKPAASVTPQRVPGTARRQCPRRKCPLAVNTGSRWTPTATLGTIPQPARATARRQQQRREQHPRQLHRPSVAIAHGKRRPPAKQQPLDADNNTTCHAPANDSSRPPPMQVASVSRAPSATPSATAPQSRTPTANSTPSHAIDAI